jgi:hypothetical protein
MEEKQRNKEYANKHRKTYKIRTNSNHFLRNILKFNENSLSAETTECSNLKRKLVMKDGCLNPDYIDKYKKLNAENYQKHDNKMLEENNSQIPKKKTFKKKNRKHQNYKYLFD